MIAVEYSPPDIPWRQEMPFYSKSYSSYNSALRADRPDTICVAVALLSGRRGSFIVLVDARVGHLMTPVRDHIGIPVDEQRLVWRGYQLEPWSPLEAYHITTGSIIY